MSKQQFNTFLVEKLITWFSTNIKVGEKYMFYSDDESQLNSVIAVLNSKQKGKQPFLDVNVPYITINGVELIFVNNTDGLLNTANIGKLRDELTENPDFHNCAMFILYKSQLDTLDTASKDLTLSGYPLNAVVIHNEIKSLIEEKDSKKDIFEYLLSSVTTIIEEDNQSAFGYETLYNSILENNVQFTDFNMFKDDGVYDLEGSPDKIAKRLKENEDIFRKMKIAVTDFPNELNSKLSDFSPEFIKENVTIDTWENNTYEAIQEDINNVKNQSIRFDTRDIISNELNYIRSESDTKAGQRTQNIVIFSDTKNLTHSLYIEGPNLSKNNLSISHNKELEKVCTLDYSKKDKRAIVSFEYDFTPTYFTLTCKGSKASDKHTFKILVLQKESFYFEDIKYNFIINPRKEHILLQLDTFKLRFNAHDNITSTLLTDKSKPIDINTFHSIDFEDFYNKNDDVSFSIINGDSSLDFEVEGSKEENSISIPFLLNPNMLDKLFDNNKDIEFNSAKSRAIIDNREFKLVFDRLDYITWEYEFIQNRLFSSTHEKLSVTLLESIDTPLYEAYTALLDYFVQHKTTPSLCAWNETVCLLAEAVVESYLGYMKKVEEDSALDKNTKLLFEFGFIIKKDRRMVSPFSPLTLAYILHLVKEVKADKSFANISEVTLSRLNIKGLFPYLFINKDEYAFSQVSAYDALWLEFVPKEKSNFSYVKKLSLEKIEEFIDSFKELFSTRAPLIINSINNDTNKELFEGIVNYYKKNFASNPKKMIINLYDSSFIQTAFDDFSDMDNYESIKDRYNLKVDAETIIDTIRTHISYSKHSIKEPQNYCHLSFFKNNEKVVIKDRTIEQTKSGLVAKGIISGESAQKEKGNYFSGFGLNNIDSKGLKHLELAQIYNAMQRPVYEEGTNYESKKTISLMVSENFKTLLQQSYEQALWTVIIDPKVTLEFFNNEEDLILIHFSDQYSSSANYDAITVTAQKELYANIVEHGASTKEKENIVKQFNAFNGEWLIKMISESEKIKKEHVSIISAYKYIVALLADDSITWVPLSVAEMIRVSGNVGLSMSGGDFTRYNENLTKGAISDDILLVGFKEDKVILYPVEVKSNHGDLAKAKEQAKALKGFFYETLFEGNTFKSRLLKGLFIRQVFMQVEKYELYNIFEAHYFDKLHNDRERLLEGTYELSELTGHSEGAVVAFLENRHGGHFYVKEGILEIQLPFELQYIMLTLSYSELREKLTQGKYDTNTKYLLSKHQPIEDDIDNIQAEEDRDKPVIAEAIEDIAPIKTEPTKPIEIKFGQDNLTDEPIYWHPTNTLENQNTCTGIIGKSGTGKTQFTKSLITQLINQSHNNVDGLKIDMLIFDYKNDYTDDDFMQATGSKTLKPFHLPYNPLALFGNQDLLPIHATNLFVTIIAKAFNLGQVQKVKLDDIIMQAYERKGISPYDKETWANPAPTMQDVWEVFEEDEKAPVDSLYAALKKIQKFQIFEPKAEKTRPLYDAIDGVTVIKLSGYDTDLQNLIVAITLDLFHTQMHIKGSSIKTNGLQQITKMILVDEADNFMSQNFESLKKILKEGREFGVGTILSTQELTHFKTAENDYASYIFTWIIHKVGNIKTQDIQSIFNLSDKSEINNLMSEVRELPKHYSFYVDGNKKITKMRDLAFWELINV